MHTIELILKGNPAALVVQRKEEAEAGEMFRRVAAALEQGQPHVLELACERTGKQVVVVTAEICSVQLTPKGGATNPIGPPTGFLKQLQENKA